MYLSDVAILNIYCHIMTQITNKKTFTLIKYIIKNGE